MMPLMEEFLHHLEYINLVNHGGKLHINWSKISSINACIYICVFF